MIGSSDSDSEDDKRVIRSAKDRRFDELQATCHEIRVSKPKSGVPECICMPQSIHKSSSRIGFKCLSYYSHSCSAEQSQYQ